MSDIKLFNIKNKKVFSNHKLDKNTMQELFEANASDILGLNIIQSNINITQNKDEILETLAIDEDYCLVVIEYRTGKFGKTINKGLVIIDYILNNKSKIKILLNELLGYDVANNVILNPRLIVVGEEFNKYDEYAVKQINIEIDLIKLSLFDKDILILEKVYQGNKIFDGKFLQRFNDEQLKVFKMISEFALSLGDEVVQKDYDNFIVYRKIKSFMYVVLKEHIEINVKINSKFKSIIIKTQKDFQKATILIEEAYDKC